MEKDGLKLFFLEKMATFNCTLIAGYRRMYTKIDIGQDLLSLIKAFLGQYQRLELKTSAALESRVSSMVASPLGNYCTTTSKGGYCIFKVLEKKIYCLHSVFNVNHCGWGDPFILDSAWWGRTFLMVRQGGIFQFDAETANQIKPTYPKLALSTENIDEIVCNKKGQLLIRSSARDRGIGKMVLYDLKEHTMEKIIVHLIKNFEIHSIALNDQYVCYKSSLKENNISKEQEIMVYDLITKETQKLSYDKDDVQQYTLLDNYLVFSTFNGIYTNRLPLDGSPATCLIKNLDKDVQISQESGDSFYYTSSNGQDHELIRVNLS